MASTSENPRFAGTDVRRPLALHESCHRLRELRPLYPRTYGVAVLADVNKRRWCPLDSVLTIDRLREVFESTAAVSGGRATADLLAARLVHEVLGRVLPLVLLEGRAWDTGLENLWVHFDRENDIDWVAVVDPTMRVLPDDPSVRRHGDTTHRDAVVVVPNESALTTWVAHRCHRTLAPLFVWLHSVSQAAISIASMWQTVGSAVVVAASQLPALPGGDTSTGFRRSQAILDAMTRSGLPVRGTAALLQQREPHTCRTGPHDNRQPVRRHLRALSSVPTTAVSRRQRP